MIRKEFLIGAILLAVIVLALAVQAVYGKSVDISFTIGSSQLSSTVDGGKGHADGMVVFHRHECVLVSYPSHLG